MIIKIIINTYIESKVVVIAGGLCNVMILKTKELPPISLNTELFPSVADLRAVNIAYPWKLKRFDLNCSRFRNCITCGFSRLPASMITNRKPINSRNWLYLFVN
jgi:hypothetical protein